jgi:hypothetical protein
MHGDDAGSDTDIRVLKASHVGELEADPCLMAKIYPEQSFVSDHFYP